LSLKESAIKGPLWVKIPQNPPESIFFSTSQSSTHQHINTMSSTPQHIIAVISIAIITSTHQHNIINTSTQHIDERGITVLVSASTCGRIAKKTKLMY
jgi:hypothetical protein